MSKCLCGGDMESTITEYQGEFVVVGNVPVYECTRCHEREYDVATLRQVIKDVQYAIANNMSYIPYGYSSEV
jgi:YgiT-type zinc finger domain-containing protein